MVRSPEHEFINTPDKQIRLNKILVGCDFSPDSEQALKHGLSLAQEFQAELHLSHVIEPPVQPNLIKEATLLSGEIQQDYHNLLIQKLKDMIPAEAANWCKPQTSIMEGQPYDELVKYADTRDIDSGDGRNHEYSACPRNGVTPTGKPFIQQHRIFLKRGRRIFSYYLIDKILMMRKYVQRIQQSSKRHSRSRKING